MLEFLKEYAEWFVLISIVTFLISLLLIPALIIRIPADYFCHDKRHKINNQQPLIKLFIIIAKNLLGGVLVISGFIMLFMPGQGLITLLIGMMIMNYPGKYTLERWLIIKFHGINAINWYRTRHHLPPLQMPDKY